MAYKIFKPGAVGASKSYDCIVETASELTNEDELVALDAFSRALVLNTDVANSSASLYVKLSNGTWKDVT